MTYGSGERRKAGGKRLWGDESGEGAIAVRADPPLSVGRCLLPAPFARRAADAALGAYLGVLVAGVAAHVSAPA